ncbi:hypothetical protein FisN_11Lu225 [Fistulifera solaris]|uniref:Uncharacterized protein n=1 Tax=Fistulifera solaris TaxID=1519565 RepID=A0A1Z5J7A9_FISSO|nr:hypothetical protein FisN_11Lu225 [Fistulifera solaris]|eukprot:GAX09802.1 hypothetical protein FisN_11Lu225 [Fistulifera solaris]
MSIDDQSQDTEAFPLHPALHESSTKSWNSESDELPPLETSTVSSGCADDDGSISSVSTLTSVSQRGVRPRALFATYWERNGGRGSSPPLPPLPDEVVASYEPKQSEEETLSKDISYEDIIQETAVRSPDIIAHGRRRIFGQVPSSSSAPFLPALAETGEIRKTKSTSALGTKKGCLRSSLRKQDRRPSDNSVTFSPKVDVRIFETPTMQWAAKGWSKLFT